MAKKPVQTSKSDQQRLIKAAKAAEKAGNKAAAKKIWRIIKTRTDRDAARYSEWKKEQSRPQYNPNGPN